MRELAYEHAVNPMTVSKAYALLESEGLLERQRGKPMRIAARRRNQAPLRERLAQIEGQAGALVLAARQLEIPRRELSALLKEEWEKVDD